MSVADEFSKALEAAMYALGEDEWAVAKARERAVESLSPAEAFESVVPVLALASRQRDTYAFASCCWLAMDLARLSDTTERPLGFDETMSRVSAVALAIGSENELAPIRQWYRHGT